MRGDGPVAVRDIRLGVLGAGYWGQRYIETIGGLSGVRLAAVSSRNAETAKRVPSGCRIDADWRAVVTDAEVDAVIIATPPALHASMALAVIDAGKPVLIEKPMTLALADSREIEAKARERGAVVMVGHTQLFNAAFRRLKRALPEIAPVRRIVSNSGKWGPFNAEVSALWEFAPHDVAMCIELLEATPTRVSAKREVHEKTEGGFGDRYLINLAFPRNITAEIRTGNLLRPKRRWLEVQGDKGALYFDDLAETKLVHRTGKKEVALAYDAERPLTTQVREFVSAARFGHADTTSVQLGREVVEVLAKCDAQFAA
jgi:predicted dehydrogenase